MTGYIVIAVREGGTRTRCRDGTFPSHKRESQKLIRAGNIQWQTDGPNFSDKISDHSPLVTTTTSSTPALDLGLTIKLLFRVCEG